MPSLPNNKAEFKPACEYDEESPASGYFVQVPVALLKNPQISHAALRLYLVLLSYTGGGQWAWPGQERLAREMQLSQRRVRSLLVELEQAGLVETRHTSGITNTYFLKTKPAGRLSGCERTAEENFRGERKKTSAHIHKSESIKHVCEGSAPYYGSEENIAATAKDPYLPAQNIAENPEPAGEAVEIQTLLEAEGLSNPVSRELAGLVVSRQRGIEYVSRIIEASREKSIHNPPGFIRFMLLREAEPAAVTGKPGNRRRSNASRRQSRPPLDFSKYTTGKYAYLAGHRADLRETAPAGPVDCCPENGPVTGSDGKEATLSAGGPEKAAGGESVPEEIAPLLGRVKTALALKREVPEKVLQYARLKIESGEPYLWFPGWVSLKPEQERTIRQTLREVALAGG